LLRDPSEGIVDEFTRAAPGFAERTKGRFGELDAVAFSGVTKGAGVLEVGAGTGHFLSLFEDLAATLVGVDITHAMLERASEDHPGILPVLGDGARLPLRSNSIDLATSAQMLHHVWQPLPILNELRRVVKPDGAVLIVDQVAPERFEEAIAMTELETVRDPSHAASRPPSAFRVLAQAAGLEVSDLRVVESKSRLSKWMWPGEFPDDRIQAVRAFIEARGNETGMDFERDGNDYTFTRRRILLRATKPDLSAA
jgi:SAM-dependent methyltransferase